MSKDDTHNMPQEAAADRNRFTARVHRIGLVTMVLAFLFSLLPTIYFVFIKGMKIPLTTFLSVIAALTPFGLGIWITEPLSHWPVFGSAGTYMAILSGNTSSMRLPVVLAARSSLEQGDDLQDPKVNIAIIVALFASIVVNLAILLVIVLGGDTLMSLLPPSVLGAFQYIIPCLIANNILLFSSDRKGDIKNGIQKTFPYLLTGIAAALLSTYVLRFLADYSSLVAVAAAIAVSYIIYRRDCARDAEKEEG